MCTEFGGQSEIISDAFSIDYFEILFFTMLLMVRKKESRISILLSIPFLGCCYLGYMEGNMELLESRRPPSAQKLYEYYIRLCDIGS